MSLTCCFAVLCFCAVLRCTTHCLTDLQSELSRARASADTHTTSHNTELSALRAALTSAQQQSAALTQQLERVQSEHHSVVAAKDSQLV
jgi:hypothetical protein